MKFLLFSLFFVSNVNAFYIECLDQVDKSTEVRFFQTEKDGPISLYAMTNLDGTPFIVNIKDIKNSQIDYDSFLVKSITYTSNNNLDFELLISKVVASSGKIISAPFPYLSSFKLISGGTLTLINSNNLTCRQFNFN